MEDIEKLDGDELEAAGNNIFTQLGFDCIGNLTQTPLLEIFPLAPLAQGDHLEFDYLIPDGNRCYVGEITARTQPRPVRDKCRKMARYITMLNGTGLNNDIWRALGVPEDKLQHFRSVRELLPFLMLNKLESFDCDLSPERTPVFYRTDLVRIQDYAESIGSFGRKVFLQAFPGRQGVGAHPIVLNKTDHNLFANSGKTVVSGGVESLADIFTFDVSPYDLMRVSHVYRNDELPDLSGGNHAYQRPLISDKLKKIREQLLCHPSFMFPNSILVVLDSQCSFDASTDILTIADHGSAVTVIDGQHRLYSYAEATLQEELEETSRILVTAIRFDTVSEAERTKFSARAFVEINSNQTRIDQTHIDSIAYDILGETTPRAIAAKVLLELNENSGPFFGLFKASYTACGVIQPKTVLLSLASMLNHEKIVLAANARPNTKAATSSLGYSNLMGETDLTTLSTDGLVQKSKIMISRYGGLLKHTFPNDWPRRTVSISSSLNYSKMMAALMKLLREFINDGLTWSQVEQELLNIKTNIKSLTGTGNDDILFSTNHDDLPKAETKQSEMFHFLSNNRRSPSPVGT